ncbi:hypothetical protein KY290_028649 [Solanum tuberosum]|uniref:Dof zinc finger protein n=1 Tax=Solanum tuberosum TaxID=4113 RepID=A0ABQ7UII9_SOLTU|nr:hypothetical protein KY290_028649 [Solanum tuberosum]
MQDPSSIYSQINHQFPDQQVLKCPRCDSINTKFCYYNNYNLSQPRHFCKNCKRYWTKGGILRNIPVGGSSRKNTKRSSSNSCKRSSTMSISSEQNSKTEHFATPVVPAFDQNSPILDANGPFGSLLASNGPEIGNFLDVLNPNGPNSGADAAAQSGNSNNRDEFLGEDSNCWNGTNGWADLAIYTPGISWRHGLNIIEISVAKHHEDLKCLAIIACDNLVVVDVDAPNLFVFTYHVHYGTTLKLKGSHLLEAHLTLILKTIDSHWYSKLTKSLGNFDHSKSVNLRCDCDEVIVIPKDMRGNFNPPLYATNGFHVNIHNLVKHSVVDVLDSLFWISPQLRTVSFDYGLQTMKVSLQLDEASLFSHSNCFILHFLIFL